MIGSGVRELPEHREQVRDACLRRGLDPMVMEELPARPMDAIRASMKLVDEADVYLGVVGYRYGHVPEGHDKSISEMEYERAVQRGIPRLVFLMDAKHPLFVGDVDRGSRSEKVDRLPPPTIRSLPPKPCPVKPVSAPAALPRTVITSSPDSRLAVDRSALPVWWAWARMVASVCAPASTKWPLGEMISKAVTVPPKRLTDEMVRAERIAALKKRDPVLSAAIDALDLEVAD